MGIPGSGKRVHPRSFSVHTSHSLTRLHRLLNCPHSIFERLFATAQPPSTMPIIELVNSAIQALKRRDQPKIEALQEQDTLTAEEEHFLDVTSNYTELATLLHELQEQDDPDTAYVEWKAAGRTVDADSTLAEAARLQDRELERCNQLTALWTSPLPLLHLSPVCSLPCHLCVAALARDLRDASPLNLWPFLHRQPTLQAFRATEDGAMRCLGPLAKMRSQPHLR